MSEWTVDDILEKLRDIDFAILLTHTESGDIAGRPMSNNRDVDYDNDSYFFLASRPLFLLSRANRANSRQERVQGALDRGPGALV